MRALILASLLATPTLQAAVFCVTTESEADTALFNARFNDQADEVRFVAGTVTFVDGLTMSDDDAYGVRLTGGWNPGCTTRSPNSFTEFRMAPTERLRFLDLAGSVSTLRPNLQYEVSNIRFIGAHNFTGASALRVTAAFNFDGRILLENLVFDENLSEGFAAGSGAVEIRSFANAQGSVVLRNARFWRNRTVGTDPSLEVVAGVLIRTDAGPVIVSNVTFWGNSTTDANATDGLLVDSRSNGPVHVVNSIFAGHARRDLTANPATRVNNTYYATLNGTGHPSSGNNLIGTHPGLVAPATGNLRLLPSSPAIGVGQNNPIGGLAQFDLDGFRRGTVVDLGAYDLTAAIRIFRDGFEPLVP